MLVNAEQFLLQLLHELEIYLQLVVEMLCHPVLNQDIVGVFDVLRPNSR